MSKSFPPTRSLRFAGIALTIAITAPRAASELDGFIKSFENNTSYIQPFATLFGSMTNSGWYQSAGVGKGFGFYFGIPMNLSYLADADRSYKGTYVDEGCRTAHSKNPSANCTEVTHYTAPTLFGRKPAPTLTKTWPDANGNITLQTDTVVNDGIKDLADFNWMPFLAPQLSVNFYHTELKLRYIGAPGVPKVSFSMPGVGIQHDFTSYLPPLPVPGFKFSVAGNMTWINAEFEPGGKVSGKLKLDGYSYFAGLLVGYNLLGWAEVFLETGWEGASLHSGGSLVLKDSNNETVNPNLSVDGRNGFRAALNVAIHFGYQAVLGQNFGAELGHQVNILGYRY